jgi:hypothetical protein
MCLMYRVVVHRCTCEVVVEFVKGRLLLRCWYYYARCCMSAGNMVA